MSRVRPLGAATLSAAGAAAAAASTGPLGRSSLRRSRGAAAPAATSAHAVPRMAVDSRKRAEYRKLGHGVAGATHLAARLYKMRRAVIFVRSLLSGARRAGSRFALLAAPLA